LEVVYTDKAREDIAFWKALGNVSIQTKITQLITAIEAEPYRGIGKPEPLKYQLTGCWSRRINREHRIVYKIDKDKIVVLSLKGHY
jgi:toxin YoeB